MEVYVFFVRLSPDTGYYLSSLTARNDSERAEVLGLLSRCPTPYQIMVHKVTIDPEAGYQSCEAFQLDADGKHVVNYDLRQADQIKQL